MAGNVPLANTNQLFSVKMNEGIIATSYAAGDKFYIDRMKLLPLSRFLPQPKGAAGAGGGGRGAVRGRGGPGRGTSFRGRGAPKGGSFCGVVALDPADDEG